MMKNMIKNEPRVGVGVMILKGGKILLGKRRGSHGAGQYAFPGGHLEHMESFKDCATRELIEECGIKIRNVKFLYLANLQAYAPKHYVHIGLIADWKSGEPVVLEPDKCESWDWHDIANLPEPLFETVKQSIECYRTGTNFIDA